MRNMALIGITSAATLGINLYSLYYCFVCYFPYTTAQDVNYSIITMLSKGLLSLLQGFRQPHCLNNTGP